MANKFLSGINVTGTTTLNTVANAGTDTDKFLVLDASGNVDFRTGDELYADLGIGSLPAGFTSTVKHAVKAGVALTKGQAVYVTGADGTNMIVGKASNASEATSSKTMGLIETALSINGIGNVITEGLLAGLDTTGATNAGDPVWLGTDGNLIYGLLNKPYAPANLVFIGIVTRINANNGEIFVKVQNGFELNESHDVDLKTTTPINGHILGYNGTLWVNKTIAGWLGYTPANAANYVPYTGATADVNLGSFSLSAAATSSNIVYANGSGSSSGMLYLKKGTIAANYTGYNGIYATSTSYGLIADTGSAYKLGLFSLASLTDNTSRTFTLPDLSGTLALLEGSQTFSGSKTFSVTTIQDAGIVLKDGVYPTPSTGYVGFASNGAGVTIVRRSGVTSYNNNFQFPLSSNDYNFPNITGTVALLEGSQTFSGSKIFSNSAKFTSLVFVDRQVNINKTPTLVAYTGGYITNYGTSNGIIYADGDTGNLTTFIYNFGGNYNYTFPASSGTIALTSDLSAYVPTSRTLTINGVAYDLSADRSWTIEAGGSSASTRTIQKFTSTSNQTTFTITGGYTVGMVDVWVNGVKLDNAVDFTASNGTTVVLTDALTASQIVEVYKYGSQFIVNNGLRQKTLFTATAGQTTFTVSYSVGLVDVYYNGSKLDDSEFTATNGTSIVLGTACAVNDKVEVIAFSYNVNGFTGIGGTGTTNYLPKFTGTSTIGNSIVQDNSTHIDIGGYALFTRAGKQTIINPNVGAGNVIADFGVGSGMGLTFTTDVERMRLTSSGNLGLGVTSPTDLLTLQRNDGRLRFNTTAGTRVMLLGDDFGSGGFMQIYDASGNVKVNFGAGLNYFNGGNLLVGTTTDAGYKLDVNGTGRFSGNVDIGTGDSRLTIGNTSSANTEAKVRLRTGSTKIAWEIGGQSLVDNALTITPSTAAGGTTFTTPALTIASTGAATFSSTIAAKDSLVLTGNYPAIQLTATSGTNFYIESTFTSNRLGFGVVGNAPSMAITSSGNVGIGTSSPTAITGFTSVCVNNATTGGFFEAQQGGTVLSRYGAQNDISFIDTVANIPFIIKTNSTERMRITSVGRVGIGTASPGVNLEVSSASTGFCAFFRNNATNANGLAIFNTAGESRLYATYAGTAIDSNLTFWTTQSNGNQSERMRITAAGKVGMNNGNPPSFLSVGNTGFANAFVYGGHDFHMIRIPVNTWTTFIDVSNNNWAGISELNWVNTVDYNRSGAAYMRWAYNSGTDSLGVVYTLFNNDQNAAAQFRNSGGALQVYITGGGADYYVQFRVMGSRAAP